MSCRRLGYTLAKDGLQFPVFWLLTLRCTHIGMDYQGLLFPQCSEQDLVPQEKLIHIICENKFLLGHRLFLLALCRIRPKSKNFNNDDNDAMEMQNLQIVILSIDHLTILILLHTLFGQEIVQFLFIIFFCHCYTEFPDVYGALCLSIETITLTTLSLGK